MKEKPWGKICLICSSPKTSPLHACFIDLHPDSSFHRFTYYFSIPTNSIKNLFTHLVADVNSAATFHVSYSHTYTHTLSNTCPATVSRSRARTLGGGDFASVNEPVPFSPTDSAYYTSVTPQASIRKRCPAKWRKTPFRLTICYAYTLAAHAPCQLVPIQPGI